MSVPAFVAPSGFDRLGENLKLQPCPHCGRVGMLIRHGFLRGRSDSGTELVLRARRIFCSNRNQRSGCGRTFPCYRADTLRRTALSAPTAWLFLSAVSNGQSLEKAFQTLDVSVSLSWSTIQRFWARFRQNNSRLRTLLTDSFILQPVAARSVMHETISHLALNLHAPPLNPVTAFQLRFQQPFLVL